MQLLQLNIDRMPGFIRRGFHLEKLGEGINVIWGPNGAGKTTACLAIRRLLWPQDSSVATLTPVVLSSIWSYHQLEERIIVEGRDYRPTSGIPCSEIQSLRPHTYTITIDELFHATDREFAEAIAREMRGGYDLHSLREQLKLTGRLGLIENRNYLQQQELLAEEIRRQQVVFERESSLDSLEERIMLAEEANKMLILVAAALCNKHVQKEYEQILGKIARFPPGIEHVRADDRARFEDLKAQKKELGRACTQLKKEEGSDIKDEAALDLCQGLIREIRILDVKIESLEQARKESCQQRIAYCGDLQIQPEELEKIDLFALDRILPYLQKQHSSCLLQEEITAKLELMESEERQAQPLSPLAMQKMLRGIALLTNWVNAAKSCWTPASLSALLCMGAITAAAYSLASLPIAGVAALMTLLTVCVIVFYPERKKYRQRYLALGLSLPVSWEEENVRLLLHALEAEWSSGLIKERNKQRKQDLLYQLKTCQKQHEELNQEIALWIQETHIENIPTYPLLANFLEQLKRAQMYRAIEKGKVALLSPLLLEREEFARRVADILGRSFFCVVEMDHALMVERKRMQEEQRRVSLLREMAILEDAVKEIFTRCGCNGPQEEDLFFERVTLLPSYLAVQQELKKSEWTLAEIRGQLASEPELLSADMEVLEQKKKALELQKASSRGLIEQKAGIEKEIDQARLGGRLEEKRLACQYAKKKLEEKKEELRQKALSLFLLEEIEESFKKEKKPEVLRKADHFFGQFTAGSYAIHGVEDETGEVNFLSLDCKEGTLKNMSELSRGTRLQLLLAIRLGVITASEKTGVRPPLILDEIASHADEERWTAIAHGLIELAKEGRQILYFTCQRSAWGAWRQLRDSSEVQFHDITKTQEHVPYIPPREEPRFAIPLDQESLRSYSQRTHQPGLDFSSPLTAQHVGHFLSTSSELYYLMQAGILTYGQLQKISETKPKYLFAQPLPIATIISKGALLEGFLTLYRVGRPLPLEKSDLEDALKSGCLTETFFPSFCGLVHETKGRADLILEALEEKKISRFPKKSIDHLREFFLQRAKIDDRTPHGPLKLRGFFWETYAAHRDVLSKEEAILFLDYLLECAFHESGDHL